MKAFAQRMALASGVDSAVAWTAAARVWTIVAGPLTLVLVATHLTPAEQGFYYTFSSIVALQVFFDLGLAFVIQQFASHEKAFLEWQPDGTIGGGATEKGRLAALLRSSMKWYGVASVLLALSLLTGGSWFLATKGSTVEGWRGPWIMLAIAAGASMVFSPLAAILEGCGRLAEVARLRTAQVVFSCLAAWTILIAGGRLWASPAVAITGMLIAAVWAVNVFRRFFVDLLKAPAADLSWRVEVWPFQWRIALSWMSGYFVLQFFTPVLFAWHGPAVAGRMGMSIAVVVAMLTISLSWLSTKVPAFGEHIARHDFAGLDALFFPTMLRSFAVMVAGCGAFFVAVLVLEAMNHPWARRMLDPLPLALLLLAAIAHHIAAAEGAYLRAHKREPLLMISILDGLFIAISTLCLGPRYGAAGMMAGFLAVTLVIALGGSTWIFIRKRREWHQ